MKLRENFTKVDRALFGELSTVILIYYVTKYASQ